MSKYPAWPTQGGQLELAPPNRGLWFAEPVQWTARTPPVCEGTTTLFWAGKINCIVRLRALARRNTGRKQSTIGAACRADSASFRSACRLTWGHNSGTRPELSRFSRRWARLLPAAPSCESICLAKQGRLILNPEMLRARIFSLAAEVKHRFALGCPTLAGIVAVMCVTTGSCRGAIPAQKDVVAILTADGWNESAAMAVIRLNWPRWEILESEDPKGWEREMNSLRLLARRKNFEPHVALLLENRPETAGLLALAADPVPLAKLLLNEKHYQLLANSFMKYVTAADVTAWTAALERHGDLIVPLLRRNVLFADEIFLYPKDTRGAAEYGEWLNKEIGADLVGSDEQIGNILNFVLSGGTTIRKRLDADAGFRRDFHSQLWPKFMRMVREQARRDGTAPSYDAFFAFPDELWEVLALPDGEQLLARTGILAIDVLFGPDRYPKSLHPSLIAVMLSGDAQTLDALMKYGKEPLYMKILEKKLPPGTIAGINHKLDASRSDYPRLLGVYAGHASSVLIEEIDPPSGLHTWLPGYASYYLIRKTLQGRALDSSDYIGVAGDLLMFVPVGGVAGKAIPGVKTALRKEALDFLAKQGVKECEKASTEHLIPWVVRSAVIQFPATLQAQLVKATTVEITQSVQAAFRLCGIGRESFKRLTGLEARLFMRADGKVFVNVGEFAAKSASGRFLNNTTEALGLGAAQQTNAGQQATRTVVEKGRMLKADAADALNEWSQNAGAWWLGIASGNLSAAPPR
jgi:hypothetical protein